MSKIRKKIVCIGAGTGVSVILSGLKKYPVELTAIVTMFDDGGSSGVLKKELGIAPVGDIRQCFCALSPNKALAQLFYYRFEKGSLRGHSVGNFVIAAAVSQTGGLREGINKIRKFLGIKSKIMPVALENAALKVLLKNGKKISGEENIINYPYLSRFGVKKVFLQPKVKVNPEAVSAIKKADLIVIAPGKFYTSILPNFLVKGIKEALQKSQAKKVFVLGLMIQPGNTDGFKVEDFIEEFEKHVGRGIIDYVVFNTGKLPPAKLKMIKKILPGAEFVEYGKKLLKRNNYIGADVLDKNIRKLNPSDILVKGMNQRTIVFHDADKLAKIILSL